MTEDTAGPSLIPPESFVALFNARAPANGQPFRGALDPLVMMAWHLASAPPPPFRMVLPSL